MASHTDEIAPVPLSSLTALIAAALRIVDSTIGALPPDDLANLMLQLQHTQSMAQYYAKRYHPSRSPCPAAGWEPPVSLNELDEERELEELAAFMDDIGISFVLLKLLANWYSKISKN